MSRGLLILSVLTLVVPRAAALEDDEDDEPFPPPAPTRPAALAPSPPPSPPPVEAQPASAPSSTTLTGALRTGLYADSDQTIVWRALAAIGVGIGHFVLSTNAQVDVVSSSSVDVRSSPGLSKVDVVTSASGNTSTSGGKMSDRRLAATLGLGWRDTSGHGINLSATYANERDYNSVGSGLNGSFDLFERATTVLGGVTFTYNWIESVLDKTFAKQMYELGWTGGVAQVLSRNDALRLRYDGAAANGYQGSPYRNVRFGDWSTSTGQNQRITFTRTLGSTDGLPETVPDTRLRHAAVLEWVHAFGETLGLYTQARLGTDSWGVQSLTAATELRGSTADWRFRFGYRFYLQSGADFYQPKYLLASTQYTYFTSDKELSHELGHVANLGIARVLKQSHYAGDARLLMDLAVNVLYYSYPDFVLLHSRTSGFVELGLTWE